MTTKKFADYIQKQSKNAYNVMLEPCFGEYLVYQHGKRIGALYENQLFLTVTDKGKSLVPDCKISMPYKSVAAAKEMILVEDAENSELLAQLINATFNELYGWEDLVADFAYIFTVNCLYLDYIERYYDEFVILLEFCYKNNLLKERPVDTKGRILHLKFINNDLTAEGLQSFRYIVDKFLAYSDRTQKTPAEKMMLKWLEEAKNR